MDPEGIRLSPTSQTKTNTIGYPVGVESEQIITKLTDTENRLQVAGGGWGGEGKGVKGQQKGQTSSLFYN